MKTAKQHEFFDSLLEQSSELREIVETGRSVEIIFTECGKVKYGHHETALTAASAMNRKTGDNYEAYQCLFCDDLWHIGHKRTDSNSKEQG